MQKKVLNLKVAIFLFLSISIIAFVVYRLSYAIGAYVAQGS